MTRSSPTNSGDEFRASRARGRASRYPPPRERWHALDAGREDGEAMRRPLTWSLLLALAVTVGGVTGCADDPPPAEPTRKAAAETPSKPDRPARVRTSRPAKEASRRAASTELAEPGRVRATVVAAED